MNLLIKPRKNSQEIVSVTPQSAGWRYVSFSAYQLTSGESLTFSDDANELCAVILRGIVSAKTSGFEWKEIGERKSVFENAATFAISCRRTNPLSPYWLSKSRRRVEIHPAIPRINTTWTTSQ